MESLFVSNQQLSSSYKDDETLKNHRSLTLEIMSCKYDRNDFGQKDKTFAMIMQ